jgi:hypothetical protein
MVRTTTQNTPLLESLKASLAAVQGAGKEAISMPIPPGATHVTIAADGSLAFYTLAMLPVKQLADGQPVNLSAVDAGKREQRVRAGIKGKDRARANEAAAAAATVEEPKHHRMARRARYYSKLHPNTSIDKLELSPVRKRILKAVHKTGKDGAREKDIRRVTRIDHGTFSSAMKWLRDTADYIEAKAEATTKPAA